MVPVAMRTIQKSTRREFVSTLGAASLAAFGISECVYAAKQVPIGLELYSVRHELEKDPAGTLARVAQMGYDCVEFYAPYFDWTPDHAKEVRAQLDKLKLRCYSTHNDKASFSGAGLEKAIELNKTLGAHYIVMSSAGEKLSTVDQWKEDS